MRCVCHGRTSSSRESARALHRHGGMPRKQRFKPSRKPKPPTTAASEVVESRPEVHPDDVGVEPTRDAPDNDPSAPERGDDRSR